MEKYKEVAEKIEKILVDSGLELIVNHNIKIVERTPIVEKVQQGEQSAPTK